MCANVPIVAMPFQHDQTLWAQVREWQSSLIFQRCSDKSSLVSRKFGAAIQLHQANTGMKGLPLGSGGAVSELEEDIKSEMQDAWETMRGPRYEAMREKMRELGMIIRKSVESGQARRAREEVARRYLSG